jgi:hypothetical protein
MVKKILILIGLSLLLLVIGFSLARLYHPTTGSGDLANEKRQTLSFNRITVENVGYLFLQQGEEQSLLIEAEDNILPFVKTEISDNNLRVGFGAEYALRLVRPSKPVRVFVIVRDLRQLTVKGGSEVEGNNLIKTDYLEINLEGDGKLHLNVEAGEVRVRLKDQAGGEIKGKTGVQIIRIEGDGQYKSKDLDSEEANIYIEGDGKALLKASSILNIEINGGGVVEYYGDPALQQKISGSGRVRRL